MMKTGFVAAAGCCCAATDPAASNAASSARTAQPELAALFLVLVVMFHLPPDVTSLLTGLPPVSVQNKGRPIVGVGARTTQVLHQPFFCFLKRRADRVPAARRANETFVKLDHELVGG